MSEFDEFAPKPKGPPRKPPAEKMRRAIQVLLPDKMYFEFLEVTKGTDVSVALRGIIEDWLNTRPKSEDHHE